MWEIYSKKNMLVLQMKKRVDWYIKCYVISAFEYFYRACKLSLYLILFVCGCFFSPTCFVFIWFGRGLVGVGFGLKFISVYGLRQPKLFVFFPTLANFNDTKFNKRNNNENNANTNQTSAPAVWVSWISTKGVFFFCLPKRCLVSMSTLHLIPV